MDALGWSGVCNDLGVLDVEREDIGLVLCQERHLSGRLCTRGACTAQLYRAYSNLSFTTPVVVEFTSFDCGL